MRHFEFWPPRLFELPYYLVLLALCARHRLPPLHLAKANYALDHGELALGSKYDTQMAFEQSRFPATMLLRDSASETVAAAAEFAKRHGFPLILKPDIGAVGKGVVKVRDQGALARAARQINTPHLLQTFVAEPEEFGVFYVRKSGVGQISGINRKHFPEVTGNGRDTIDQLARRHERYSEHWPMFLKYLATDRVPAAGERVRLSFVGSHTMGCRFTNDTSLGTPALLRAIDAVCASQPGFNFGRLDVRAASPEALQAGSFTIIEVNGVASLPAHMFDPDHSLWQGYRIFFEHARHMTEVAAEHREQAMELLPFVSLLRKARRNARTLDALQEAVVRGD
ncbi:MAG: hypothetical protein AB8B93_05320 [Pseudomonadales bacterium]